MGSGVTGSGGILLGLILGRDCELERLGALIDRAQAGSGGLAVLEGPAGIGKTALLAEVARRADGLGFSVLRGGGARLERDYAFGVVRQLYARAVGSRTDWLTFSTERVGSRGCRSAWRMRPMRWPTPRAIRRRPCTACSG